MVFYVGHPKMNIFFFQNSFLISETIEMVLATLAFCFGRPHNILIIG